MKPIRVFPKTLFILTLFIFVSPAYKTVAQEAKQATLKPFTIAVERTDSGLKLSCTNGCAWKDLEFTAVAHRPYVIDQNGMTTLKNHSYKGTSDLPHFLFTVTKETDQVTLKGIKGTAWNSLQFSLPNNKVQAIDPYGMTNTY